MAYTRDQLEHALIKIKGDIKKLENNWVLLEQQRAKILHHRQVLEQHRRRNEQQRLEIKRRLEQRKKLGMNSKN